MDQMKTKNIVSVAVLALILVGCSQNVELTTEQHKITSIEGNEIYGELVEGNGEGIFYTKQDFEEMGIENVKVGDVVEISWTTENYNNEEWEMYSLDQLN
jgi:hypothetical protein